MFSSCRCIADKYSRKTYSYGGYIAQSDVTYVLQCPLFRWRLSEICPRRTFGGTITTGGSQKHRAPELTHRHTLVYPSLA